MDAVFYILKSKLKLTVVSEQGRKAVVAILERKTSSMKHRRPSSTAIKISDGPFFEKVVVNFDQTRPGNMPQISCRGENRRGPWR